MASLLWTSNVHQELQHTAVCCSSTRIPEILLTCVREYVSFEVVAAAERAVAVVADEVLLDLQRAVIVHVDG